MSLSYPYLCANCKKRQIRVDAAKIIKMVRKRMSWPEISKVTTIPVSTLHDHFREKSELSSKGTSVIKPDAIENTEKTHRENPETSESQEYFGKIFKKPR